MNDMGQAVPFPGGPSAEPPPTPNPGPGTRLFLLLEEACYLTNSSALTLQRLPAPRLGVAPATQDSWNLAGTQEQIIPVSNKTKYLLLSLFSGNQIDRVVASICNVRNLLLSVVFHQGRMSFL